jgi:hypothetical protein
LNNWRELRRLSRRERGLLAQALVMIPLTALALRVVGLGRWRSALGHLTPARRPPGARPAPDFENLPRITARMVRVAAAHGLSTGNCLSQSLVLWWLLRRQGIEGELKFGARKGGAALEAHAWVELASVALNDGDDVRARFTPFECVAAAAEKSR